jgi:hypothetical protein
VKKPILGQMETPFQEIFQATTSICRDFRYGTGDEHSPAFAEKRVVVQEALWLVF